MVVNHSTLLVKIKQFFCFYGKIIGLIEGLAKSMGQRSSVVEQSFHKRSVTGSIPVVGTYKM
jgi:hypothetical protein